MVLTEHSVARAAAAAGIAVPVRFRESIDSTNAELVRLADEGAPAWTVVAANHQRAGRGRLGRTWEAEPGSSLLVSVLVRPAVPAPEAGLMTLAAGACMAVAVSVACGVDVRCKWPNDLVVDDRKLGGILTEASVREDRVAYAVIGSGVNLEQGPDDFLPELRGAATSVAMEGGRPDAGALLHEYLMRLRRFADPSEAGFASAVPGLARQVSATVGREVRAVTTTGATVVGTASGIGDRGELIVQTSAGVRQVLFGEIEHLR